MKRLVILAPNWLGDAVMALPAVADLRRGLPGVEFAVAARPAVAPLFRLVPAITEVITLERRGWRAVRSADNVLAGRGFDAALLLPNSFHAALVASRAGIPERWGFRTDWRGRLLTRAVRTPSGLHQAEYYQQLVHALGYPMGPMEPRLDVPAAARASAVDALQKYGWDGTSPLVAIAPGAAYGGAKRWPPERFAALASALADDDVRTIMIGSAADRSTGAEVTAAMASGRTLADLMGKTDLAALTAILTHCHTLVTNDSGAMHLAAAVGTRVTAVFGPTDERATRPLGGGHALIAGEAWCRPCMLRECPLDHRCMRSIETDPVLTAARRTL